MFNGSTSVFQTESVDSTSTCRSNPSGGSQFKINGKTHYERNKVNYIAKVKRRRQFIAAFMWRVKQRFGCKDCGIKNPVVLEFDHIKPGKTTMPSHMSTRGWSLKRVKSELRLCEIVCANCHRIRTYNRRVN